MNMVVDMRPFEEERFKRLLELAQSQFDQNITEPEAQVLVHSAAGYPLPTPYGTDPRLRVRAEFLRWLLTDLKAAKHIDSKGVCFSFPGARRAIHLPGPRPVFRDLFCPAGLKP